MVNIYKNLSDPECKNRRIQWHNKIIIALDLGLIPGLGRSCGEGNGNPLQYSYLENSMGWKRVGHDFMTSLFTFILVDLEEVIIEQKF